jgi:hypothetical protein
MNTPTTATNVYEAHVDSEHRLVIRNPEHMHYTVQEFSDGHIELLPLVEHAPEPSPADESISMNTLAMLDSAMDNLRLGRVSEPVDAKNYYHLLNAEEREELEQAREQAREQVRVDTAENEADVESVSQPSL